MGPANLPRVAVATCMAQRGIEFLDCLQPKQKHKAMYEYSDGERLFWYYAPLNRHGLPLRDMLPYQRKRALALMATGLTANLYKTVHQIMELETILGSLERNEGRLFYTRDPELYYFTMFGRPGGNEPWGWRVEGHHISLNFSVMANTIISTTPFFLGANPANITTQTPKGFHLLGAREDIAFELINSLDFAQKSKAIVFSTAPYDILTSNSSRVSLPMEEGIPASKISQHQMDILMSVVAEYINQVPGEAAKQRLAKVRESDINQLRFVWGGSTQPGTGHYYRIHGGTFVIEFDNTQNSANHIHSVWRDIENDFAADILRDHFLGYHAS